MFRLSKPYFAPENLAFFLGETFLIMIAFCIAFFVWFWAEGHAPIITRIPFLKASVFVGITQMTLYYNGMYQRQGYKPVEMVTKLMISMVISSGILIICYYVFPVMQLNRGLFVVAVVFSLMLITSVRLVGLYFISRGKFSQRIIVIGTGQRAAEIADLILKRKDSGYTLVGFIEEDKEHARRSGQISPENISILDLLTPDFQAPKNKKGKNKGLGSVEGPREVETP